MLRSFAPLIFGMLPAAPAAIRSKNRLPVGEFM